MEQESKPLGEYRVIGHTVDVISGSASVNGMGVVYEIPTIRHRAVVVRSKVSPVTRDTISGSGEGLSFDAAIAYAIEDLKAKLAERKR